MATQGYKKYMKKDATKDYSLLKIFVLSFFGMLLVFTFLIKSFSPSVDVSIGDYKQEADIEGEEAAKNGIDSRLSLLQDEDRGRNFADLMRNADDEKPQDNKTDTNLSQTSAPVDDVSEALKTPAAEPIYKVYIGSYTSAEQAKVAKDIIQETGANLNPIVKCIGSNNYTLQVGLFKNKNSAETLLNTVQQNHLPGRIVQEY